MKCDEPMDRFVMHDLSTPPTLLQWSSMFLTPYPRKASCAVGAVCYEVDQDA